MAKGGYSGIDNVSRKIKKGYIGDENGKARKLKKAYIGDENGKARLCWSGNRLIIATVYGSGDVLAPGIYYSNNNFKTITLAVATDKYFSPMSTVTSESKALVVGYSPYDDTIHTAPYLMYSIDGISWSDKYRITSSDGYRSAGCSFYGGGTFLIPDYGLRIFISQDNGVSWVSKTYNAGDSNFCYGKGLYLCSGKSVPHQPYYTTNLFTSITSGSGHAVDTTQGLVACWLYSPKLDMFVTLNKKGNSSYSVPYCNISSSYSKDGKNWSNTLYNTINSNLNISTNMLEVDDCFYALAYDSYSSVMYTCKSSDGIGWTFTKCIIHISTGEIAPYSNISPYSGYGNTLIYQNGEFITCCTYYYKNANYRCIIRSTDCLSWTIEDSVVSLFTSMELFL